MNTRKTISTLAVALAAGLAVQAASPTSGMQQGRADLKSSGPLAFGPEGILFVSDPQDASIYAIATGDTQPASASDTLNVEALNHKVAALLGTSVQQIIISDLAVNPISRHAYLAVSRGQGPEAVPVLVKVGKGGTISVLNLDNVKFSRATMPDAPAPGISEGRGGRQQNRRRESITDLAFQDGRLLVAGLSNEEFASSLRSIPFPFSNVDKGASVEIYHGAHGRFETESPVRTFVPYKIKGEAHVLAAYQCTPLVKFPLSALKPGTHVKGTTIAELGNRNRPLDMIVYQKDGKDFILMANNSRGIMKITTENIDGIEPILARVDGGGTKGIAYETIADWKGIEQLDKFDAKHALVVRTSESGQHLETLPLP